MDTSHDDTARAAIHEARCRLRAARYHGTHPPAITRTIRPDHGHHEHPPTKTQPRFWRFRYRLDAGQTLGIPRPGLPCGHRHHAGHIRPGRYDGVHLSWTKWT